MPTRPGVFWLWRRYMMVAIEPARPGSAEWGFKSFGTRCLAAYACMREKGVVRFNGAGPDGLINRKAPGTAPLLNADQKQALAKAVEDGPKPYIDGVVRWRIRDLIYRVYEEFGISLSRTTMGRTLKGLGFVKLTARPQHYRQDEAAMEDFKKHSPYIWTKSGKVSQKRYGRRGLVF